MMQPGLISILCWEEKSTDDATVKDSWHNELDEYMLSLASLVSLWPLVPLVPEQKIKVFGVKST